MTNNTFDAPQTQKVIRQTVSFNTRCKRDPLRTLKRVPHSSPRHSTEHWGPSQSIKAAFYRLSLESTKAWEWCVCCVCARRVRVGVEVTCSYVYAGCTSWGSLRVGCAHSTVEMPEAISVLLLPIHPQFTMALFNRRLAGVRNCLSLSL